MTKRGQITIFMIIAVIIISVVALFFILRGGIIPGIGEGLEKNPNVFLQVCIEDKLREGIELISLQGGYVENPLHINFKFEDEKDSQKISYLCYNRNDFELCINQKPMLMIHLERELSNYVSEEVNNCFRNKLTSSLEKSRYDVNARYEGFELNLNEGEIAINIDAELILTKGGETIKQENFNLVFPSKFYDLALMVQEIINIEATTGEFNHFYFKDYPNFDISKYRTRDSSVIYTIRLLEGKEKFRFAVRGAVVPSGFGINL